MNAIVRSSSSTLCAGQIARHDLQKMQSGSLTRPEAYRSLAQQLAGGAIASSRDADLAREARLLELGEQPPELGPGVQLERSASSSPRSGGRGGRRPTRAPRRASAGPARGAGDRLLGTSPRVASRSATLRRHVHLPGAQRRGSGRSPPDSGISCTRNPSRRWWRASAATWSPSRSLARSRVRTRPRSARRRRAHERDSPPGAHRGVCGFAMSWSSAPKRSACQRVSSLASGSASSSLTCRASDRAPARARSSPSPPPTRPGCGRVRRDGGTGSARCP